VRLSQTTGTEGHSASVSMTLLSCYCGGVIVSPIVAYTYMMIHQTREAVDVPSLPHQRGLATHHAWRIVRSLAADS